MSKMAVWQEVKAQLAMQMTTSTYDQWLRQAYLVSEQDGRYVVGVQSAFAVDWLQNRLYDVVLRTLRAVTGQGEATVEYVVAAGGETRKGDDEAAVESSEFPGFEPFRANFVQVPKQYFEVVIPDGPPVVVAFVGAVIAQTVGVIVNFHTNERREWWEASYGEIGRVSGIKSKASVGTAVRLSRARGYVKRAGGQFDYRYRLRQIGEPKDD